MYVKVMKFNSNLVRSQGHPDLDWHYSGVYNKFNPFKPSLEALALNSGWVNNQFSPSNPSREALGLNLVGVYKSLNYSPSSSRSDYRVLNHYLRNVHNYVIITLSTFLPVRWQETMWKVWQLWLKKLEVCKLLIFLEIISESVNDRESWNKQSLNILVCFISLITNSILDFFSCCLVCLFIFTPSGQKRKRIMKKKKTRDKKKETKYIQSCIEKQPKPKKKYTTVKSYLI